MLNGFCTKKSKLLILTQNDIATQIFLDTFNYLGANNSLIKRRKCLKIPRNSAIPSTKSTLFSINRDLMRNK